MKIVINRCIGGYGLSREAILGYAEKIGIQLYYVDLHKLGVLCFYTKPIEELEGLQVIETNGYHFDEYSISRSDPLLVNIVETLGSRANGQYAQLKVVEVPDDVQWHIVCSGNGIESVHENHKVWE